MELNSEFPIYLTGRKVLLVATHAPRLERERLTWVLTTGHVFSGETNRKYTKLSLDLSSVEFHAMATILPVLHALRRMGEHPKGWT